MGEIGEVRVGKFGAGTAADGRAVGSPMGCGTWDVEHRMRKGDVPAAMGAWE